MNAKSLPLNSLIPDTLTPDQQKILDKLAKAPGLIGHEKYYFGTCNYDGNPMTPEAFDDKTARLLMFGTLDERVNGKFERDKEVAVRQSREFLIGSYLLSPRTESLGAVHEGSPIVTVLVGELRRYVERFHGISRDYAKITGDLVAEYCGRFNLPRLTPIIFERLGSV